MFTNATPLASRFERIVPWIVLAILAVFTYAFFFRAPYLGFRYSNSAEVVEVYVPNSGLEAGDRIDRVGPISWDEFAADEGQTWLDVQQAGAVIPLQFSRNGQVQTLSWTVPGPTSAEVVQRLNSQWWLGYVFWLAGTAALLLVRPRDTRWRLLVAFNYLTAVWLVAGTTSSWHVWGSNIVLKSAIWLSVPVTLHLNWSFPQPLGRLPRPVLWAGYGAAVLLAVAEWLQLVPNGLFLYGFLLALAGSAGLLLVHFVRRPEDRRDVGLLAAAVLLVALPPAAVALANALGASLPGSLGGGALLAFPAVAGAYFFTIYRRQLGPKLASRVNRLVALYLILVFSGIGLIVASAVVITLSGLAQSVFIIGAVVTALVALTTIISFAPFLLLPAVAGAYVPSTSSRSTDLEFRANRLVTPFLFFVLLASAVAIFTLLLSLWLDFPGASVLIGLTMALLAGIVVVIGYRPFQRLVDRRLLGLRLPPAGLLEAFAARITTCLDVQSLVKLLEDEVLPSLSIRQSAILLLEEPGEVVPFLVYGLSATELPEKEVVVELLGDSSAGRDVYGGPADLGLPAWIRLALTLHYGSKAMGLWLMGRRDPDDLYARAELPLFQALADQSAVALTNLRHTENLRALYREDIDRHEAERARLARVLHDEVLNELAVLALFADEQAHPEFQEAYTELTKRVRQTIGGLRSAMLQYGLRAALHDLADELTDRCDGQPRILTTLQASEFRYPERVEQHLFRIVQQALENAIRHAQAQMVQVRGSLKPGRVELTVEDDGVGFPAGEQLDLTSLLAGKHFGLAGMYERAALIDARLEIRSSPGKGTSVSVSWCQDGWQAPDEGDCSGSDTND